MGNIKFLCRSSSNSFSTTAKEQSTSFIQSREEAYEAYRKGEKRYYEFHAQALNIGARIFGGMLILVGTLGLFGMFYEGHFVNFGDMHPADRGWVILGFLGIIL